MLISFRISQYNIWINPINYNRSMEWGLSNNMRAIYAVKPNWYNIHKHTQISVTYQIYKTIQFTVSCAWHCGFHFVLLIDWPIWLIGPHVCMYIALRLHVDCFFISTMTKILNKGYSIGTNIVLSTLNCMLSLYIHNTGTDNLEFLK